MTTTEDSAATLPQSMLNKRTVCVGRFLLDVSLDAEIVFGRQQIDGRLEYLPNSAERLEILLNRQLAQLNEDRILFRNHMEDLPRYGEVIDGAAPDQRIVFGSDSNAILSFTSYIPKPPHLFLHTVSGTADNPLGFETINRVSTQLRLRAADEIPSERGVCVEGGFLPFDPEYENIAIGMRLRDHPDVHFSLRTTKHRKYLPRSSMIEERIQQAEELASPTELLWHKRIRYLRRGPRKLSMWAGEEVAARLPAQEGMGESHRFAFVSLGEINNPFHPHIDIELVSGVKKNARGSVKPSLSDEQMLLLWDTLLNSIRIRPTTPVQSKPAPKAALGAAHVTGRTCPQTGWWECNEPGVIAEARRKLIREGELMPRTTVKLDRSGWEKLKGRPEQIQRPTVWTLAEYAQDSDLDQNGIQS